MALLARGSVADRPWGLTFGALGVRGLTGELAVVVDGKTFRCAFDQGAIVGAHSPLASDAAVRIALTGNLITSTQVADITRRMAAAPDRDEIDLLAELARLGPDQATRLRRRLVANRAARVFSVERGEFTVDDGFTLPIVPGSELDIRAVCYLGAKTNYGEERLGAELAALGGSFQLKPEVVEDLAQYGFTDAEKPALQMLLQGADLTEVEHANPSLGARGVRAVVYALVSCGACEIRPAARPAAGGARPPGQSAPQARPASSTRSPSAQGASASAPNATSAAGSGAVRAPLAQPGSDAVRAPSGSGAVRVPSAQPGSGAVRIQRAPSQAGGDDGAPPVRRRIPSPPQADDEEGGPTVSLRSSTMQADDEEGGPTVSLRSSTPQADDDEGGPRLTPQTDDDEGGPRLTPQADDDEGGPTVSLRSLTLQADDDDGGSTVSLRSLTSQVDDDDGGATVLRRSSTGAPPMRSNPLPERPHRTSRPPPVARRAKRNTAAALEVEQLLREKIPMLDGRADHFTVLGVSTTATDAEIRKMYFDLARKLHPDRISAIGVTDDARDVQRLMAQINASFAVLNDPNKRAEYTSVQSRGGEAAVRAQDAQADEMAMQIMRAEEAFRKGEMALRRDQLAQAVAAFHEATQLQPNESEYQASFAWAQFAAAPDKTAIASQTRRVLLKAAEQNERSPTARFYLGRVERMLGKEKEALQHFREVLRLKPGHTEAASEARVLEQRLKGKR